MTGRDQTDPRKFELLDGGWVSAPDWLNFPATLRARSPTSRDQHCRVRLSRADINKAAGARRRQPAYDLWGVVLGRAPPVPHHIPDADQELTSLFDAHACFRGIRRPIAEDTDGAAFLAYVLRPKFFFKFDPRPPLAFTEKRSVPEDLVFVAYVRLDEPADGAATKGVLTHWHFVESDSRDRSLPLDFDARYMERLW